MNCAICMYTRFRRWIPVKTWHERRRSTVNAGLPFIRTSRIHGTPLSDMPHGNATNPSSLIAAMRHGRQPWAAVEDGMTRDRRPFRTSRGSFASTALSARKSLGQNFMLDLNLTARIPGHRARARSRRTPQSSSGPGHAEWKEPGGPGERA